MKNINDPSQNPYFSSHAEDYADQIMATQPTFYKNSGALLDAHLPAGGAVLDVGNGGVINYDYRRLSRLDCADLAVSKHAVKKYQDVSTIRFLQADATALTNISDSQYDAVIVQALLHHLAGRTFAETRSRVCAAVSECLRVLKPGGKLLIVESTVTPWFEWIERLTYPLMQGFFALSHFGYVYQFSPKSLHQLLVQLMKQVPASSLTEGQNIDVGPHIWIMGRRLPSWLTPCGVTFYVLEK